MKKDSIIKTISLILLLSFLSLYLSNIGGYYEYNLSQKNTLTEEAIKRFEDDVSAGKEIIASNYIIEQKDYSNTANKLANKLSNFLANLYDKTMQFIFSQISNTINK